MKERLFFLLYYSVLCFLRDFILWGAFVVPLRVFLSRANSTHRYFLMTSTLLSLSMKWFLGRVQMHFLHTQRSVGSPAPKEQQVSCICHRKPQPFPAKSFEVSWTCLTEKLKIALNHFEGGELIVVTSYFFIVVTHEKQGSVINLAGVMWRHHISITKEKFRAETSYSEGRRVITWSADSYWWFLK